MSGNAGKRITLDSAYMVREGKLIAEEWTRRMHQAYAEKDTKTGLAYELCLSDLQRLYGVLYPADWERIVIHP